MSLLKKIVQYKKVKFDKPNKIDCLLAATILKILPKKLTPNQLTIIRYLTVPLIFYFLLEKIYFPALILFSLSAFTDMLDGALARTKGMITAWGKIHDPLADKLLIGVSGGVLITRYINVETILVILLIEFLTVFIAIHNYDHDDSNIGARLPGKIKMVCQSFGMVFLLVFAVLNNPQILSVATLFFYLAIVFGLFNILIYKAL